MTDIALTPPGTSTRRQLWRLASIGLFLGLPLGCLTVAGFALTSALESSQIADHADETARAIVHQLDHKPAQALARGDIATLYLASPSASLARAELQALATRLIDAAGGRLVEVRPADDAEQDQPGKVSIEITLGISNAGLLDLLYTVETGLPLIAVPRLDARSDAGNDGQPNGDLQVTLTLIGGWRAAPQ